MTVVNCSKQALAQACAFRSPCEAIESNWDFATTISPNDWTVWYNVDSAALFALDMPRLFFYLRWLVLGSAFVRCPTVSHADTCVMPYKRAPVKAVCGRVTNPVGEKLNKVDLTLTDEKGAVLFTTSSDNEGRFSFGSISKGDYLLRAKAPSGYMDTQREIRVIKSSQKRCSPKIEVRLGTGTCTTFTYIKGVDKGY